MPCPTASDRGFTILELLVVLAIGAMALAVAVPIMRSSYDSAVLRAAAGQLAATMRSLRSEAIRSNRPQTLAVDPAGGSYLASNDAQQRRLPPGVILRVLGNGAGADVRSGGVILFYPDGSATAVVLELGDGSRSAVVEVEWQTGTARPRWRS